MTGHSLRTTASAWWSSRAATIALLAGYCAWVASGLLVGSNDVRDADRLVDARVWLQATRTRTVNLEGHASLVSLRQHHQRAYFRGPSTLAVRCDDAERVALRLVVEADEASVTSELRFRDRASAREHTVRDLRPWRVHLTIPLPRATTTITIEPDQPDMPYRLISAAVVAALARDELVVEREWKPLFDNKSARGSAGSGWWPHGSEREAVAKPYAPGDELFARRRAWLRIEPKHPGECWVRLPFRKIDRRYPDPRLTVDGQPVSPDLTTYVALPMRRAAFPTCLRGESVLGIELDGPMRSVYEAGGGADQRRMSYGVLAGQIELTPTDAASRPSSATKPR